MASDHDALCFKGRLTETPGGVRSCSSSRRLTTTNHAPRKTKWLAALRIPNQTHCQTTEPAGGKRQRTMGCGVWRAAAGNRRNSAGGTHPPHEH